MSLRGTLVFSSGRSGDFDLWTLELETLDLRQLTSGKGLHDFPRWSPDGRQIAYIGTSDDLISSLWIMNRDGSGKKRLTFKVHAQHPSWSADGKSILFTANVENGEEVEICSYDLTLEKYELLMRRSGQETEPCLSPDGSRLLFASINPDSTEPFVNRDTEIWEHDLASGEERKICSHPARDYCPVYSPDGKRIAFVSHRNGRSEETYLAALQEIKSSIQAGNRSSIDAAIRRVNDLEKDSDIYLVNRDGSNLCQVTKGAGAEVGLRWSPCGQYIVYTAAPASEGNKQRLRIVEADTGKNIPIDYDRRELMKSLEADPESYLNQNWLMKLVPDFMEKPFKMWYLGAYYWGEEHQPDWTYS
jgi:Tol biopolymer transport system component